jgi:hypothetical protein
MLAQNATLLRSREAAARDMVRDGIAETKRLELALEASQRAARILEARRLQTLAEDAEQQRARP